MSRPLALITNDDSIVSPLLDVLVRGALEVCDVAVVAPATEQSWIGRAFSRYRPLDITPVDKFTCSTWTVSGTPSDCVNIGIHHLLPRRPDIVLSGVNIGYNATATFIYSSGTVGGAIEGAFHSIPAIAFSKALPNDAYYAITEDHRVDDPGIQASLREDQRRIPDIIMAVLKQPVSFGTVWNVNFPEFTNALTSVSYAEPARIPAFSFYEIREDKKAHFHFSTRERVDLPEHSDLATLRRGQISISQLEFSYLLPHLSSLSDDPLNLQS